ncbi:glycoside hydrolase family 88 protein [Paenibacillus sp. FSL H7-0326]|uniref:glycoside hydrolase family 88 protein n=1 Tax=Paenibacillus sp. FSL H7-0326 TaxID=1921144 RepID=UPI0015C3C84E|nr:glycoside hydrolase family 88 protein [Paenibacillus sp. FSL H7-0326]
MYCTPDYIEATRITLPSGKRIPFGWEAAPIGSDPDRVTQLHWNVPGDYMQSSTRFRLTVAIDVREEKMVQIYSLASKKVLGYLDIRFSSVFQTYEVIFTQEDTLVAIREGVGLKLIKGSEPLWFFTHGSDKASIELVFKPHLLTETKQGNITNFRNRFASLASIQQFGWMEGCVLDGLMDLGYSETAKSHLDLYVSTELDKLIYEDPRSQPVDGQFYGIESLLPIAIMAKIYPQNPILYQAINYMNSRKNKEGAIQDKSEVSCEGNYTIAYPLACLANTLDDSQLAEESLLQLAVRRKLLWKEHTLYLRFLENGSHTFKNWGRAYVWYLLGIARTIKELKSQNRLSEASEEYWKEEFIRAWNVAWSYRNNKGLWFCYVDDSGTGVEISTSAGIAAATALGIELKYLSSSYQPELKRTLNSLLTFLTPDGLITGTSQGNKGGEDLQRNGYRVLSQVSMGLLAQLINALEELDSNK